jgi:phenylacetic acid degradation operon negative regulatory protein
VFEIMRPATATARGDRPEHDSRLAQLIMSVFALYARPDGDWLSVAAVVRLLGDLGMDGQAVRSAVSRLKRRGTLESERRHGQAGYTLPQSTLDILADGDLRIFQRTRADVGDGWLLVVFSVPETERGRRHALRTTLTRLGFGTTAPGVWIAPGTLVEETRHALRRGGLSEYAELFVGAYASARDQREDVRLWWNLPELDALYADFIQRFGPVRDATPAGGFTAAEAFRAYIPLLTQWRRLPYRDPGLPLALLPDNWRGETAAGLFAELDASLRPGAAAHAQAAIDALRARP